VRDQLTISFLVSSIRTASPAAQRTAVQCSTRNFASVATAVTDLKLQVLQLHCVLSDDLKNCCRKEKQPAVENSISFHKPKISVRIISTVQNLYKSAFSWLVVAFRPCVWLRVFLEYMIWYILCIWLCVGARKVRSCAAVCSFLVNRACDDRK
jgi:hypothetical protein